MRILVEEEAFENNTGWRIWISILSNLETSASFGISLKLSKPVDSSGS